MSNVCERCGQGNRATAMFCIGCTGKLPGFAPSGPSVLEGMKMPSRPARSVASGPPDGGEPLLPSETQSFWLLLGALAVLMMLGFMGWFLHVRGLHFDFVRGWLVPPPGPVTQRMATDEVVPPFAPWPQVTERRPSLPVSASGPTPEPKADFGSLPDVRTRELSRPIAKSTGKLPIAPPGELIVDQQVQAVEKFYRALSAADGKKAAAIVIPAKRGIGPFNEANISRFYGSFQRPLLIRSIRPIDARRVEAKYSYQFSTTTCEGTAIVETQRVSQETLIRSIRANC